MSANWSRLPEHKPQLPKGWGTPIPDFGLTSALISQLESMSGFHADTSHGSTRDIPCDWGARVVNGTYEGKRAFKIYSTSWTRARPVIGTAPRGFVRACRPSPNGNFPALSRWSTAACTILPKYSFLPNVDFGLLWSRAETAAEDKKLFRGTSNFVSLNLATRTRSTVNLDEQIRRHEDALADLSVESDADFEILAERKRLQGVIEALTEGISVFCVMGALHPFTRDSIRRWGEPQPLAAL